MINKPVEICVVVERGKDSLNYFFHGILLAEDKDAILLEDFLAGKQTWNKSELNDIHLMSELEQKIFGAKYPRAADRMKLYEVDEKIKNKFIHLIGGNNV